MAVLASSSSCMEIVSPTCGIIAGAFKGWHILEHWCNDQGIVTATARRQRTSQEIRLFSACNKSTEGDPERLPIFAVYSPAQR